MNRLRPTKDHLLKSCLPWMAVAAFFQADGVKAAVPSELPSVNSRIRIESISENVRLAQALIVSDRSPIKGSLFFEQMPNSVIITYRLEGLTPKKSYQIFVKEQPGCEPVDLSPAMGLRSLRGYRSGISQNTFRTEQFSVSNNRSLLGQTIVITTRETESEMSRSVPLACGVVHALHPAELSPQRK